MLEPLLELDDDDVDELDVEEALTEPPLSFEVSVPLSRIITDPDTSEDSTA